MQNVKAIAFKQIIPVKFLGINNKLSFNSLIGESKLLYLSGRNIVLENIKTYDQKVIWTNQYIQSPQFIVHITNIHRQNLLGIAIKDDTNTHMIAILNINSQINNYEHLNKKEKEKNRYHYLKNIEPQMKITKLMFLNEGSFFVIIASLQTQLQDPRYYMHFYRSSTGDLIHSLTSFSQQPLIQTLQINRANHVCILNNQPEKDRSKLVAANRKYDYYQRARSVKSDEKQQMFKVSLINLSDLKTHMNFYLQISSGQKLLEVKFHESHKKTFCSIVLNSGFILLALVNQAGFQQVTRIDCKVSKQEHFLKMKVQKQKAFFNSSQSQSLDESSPQPSPLGKIKFPKRSKFSVENTQKQIPSNKPQQRHEINSNFIDRKTLLQANYLPICIACTSCKIVIGYENCNYIGIVTFSAINHQSFKFKYIFDFFYQREHIQSVRKINFSEDDCHCSVLVKVQPKNICAPNKINASTKILNKYQTNEDQNQFSRGYFLNTKKGKKRAHIDATFTQESLLQMQEQEQIQQQYFQVVHVDFISGTIEHQYHHQSIESSLAGNSLKGTVQLSFFNQMNNTMMFLMSNGTIYYYYLNVSNVKLDGELFNSNRPSFLNLKNSLQSKTSTFKTNNVPNYLSPDSILLWNQKTKIKPNLLILHPVVFQMVLMTNDTVKFHYYNCQKLFECHHVISLKNCKAASYSPFGDKLVLGTVGSIWLIDSYTHQIIKKISLVIFPTATNSLNRKSAQKNINPNFRRTQSISQTMSSKTVSKIKFINNQDLMLQTGNTTLSMLLNYQKVVYFGITDSIPQQLITYDFKHKLGVIADGRYLKVITKCGINTKNKCEQVVKMQISLSSLKLCSQIGILLMGGTNGVLYFVRWPEFFLSDNLKCANVCSKKFAFHSPIVSIETSMNYKYLYLLSRDGQIMICQLIQSDQVDKIGTDVSYVMSKKIDIQLPLMNRWLVSTLDEERHAQNITKLMGNQAEIKNNQIVLAEEYKNMRQKLAKAEQQVLDRNLKKQIKDYQINSGVSKLQVDINTVRDETKRIIGKRQKQVKDMKYAHQQQLHALFADKTSMEVQLSQLIKNIQKEKQDTINSNKEQFSNYENLIKMEIDCQIYRNKDQSRMFDEKTKVDKALDINIKQDFLDEKLQIQRHFGEKLSEVYARNNQLTTQNRNKKVQIIQMTDKMREISARVFQLQNDVEQLEIEQKQVQRVKNHLKNDIKQNDKKYHMLIKKTKQYEIILNQVRTSSESDQLIFDTLSEQLDQMQLKWQQLQQKKKQAQEGFNQQFKLKNLNSDEQTSTKKKVRILKNKRKYFFDYSVTLKNIVKLYQHTSKIGYNQETKKQFLKLSESIEQIIAYKKGDNYFLVQDVDKWNSVKDQNKRQFIKNSQRLQQENNKLIYRYNQLKKQFQGHKRNRNKLVNKIQQQKQIINDQKYNKVNQSKQNVQNSTKFASTSCHFFNRFSSNSQPSQVNSSNFQSVLKNKLNLIHGPLSSKNKQPTTKKLSDNNILARILKKSQKPINKKSQLKTIQFDKNTLKPKKTLCISLHSDGETSKFVTQY